MNIIGISALYHDSACCLIQDGKLVAAAEEERFTKIKHDAAIPAEAFRYCMKAGGIQISDIDAVGYYENPQKKLGRQIWMAVNRQIDPLNKKPVPRLDATRPEWEIRTRLGFGGPIHFFDHHESHAASSFYFSGYKDAAILTVDGVGEWATTTYGRGHKTQIEILKEIEFPDSLGLFYSAFTSYLGFSVNDAEYKVMGLAPYGKPVYAEKIFEMIHLAKDGHFNLNSDYFDFMGTSKMFTEKLVQALGRPARTAESSIDQFHKDVARSLQFVLEDTLLKKCHDLYEMVPSENLCMAGGVALNCVANGRIKRDGPFKNLFVQPAASDAGSALGAAALAYVKETGQRHTQKQIEHVLLGPEYSTSEIKNFLEVAQIPFLDFQNKPKTLIDEVAQRIADQKVIGWFHGRMEFGPRALGGRSILADPRNSEMRDRINALVKKREAFRPFAPSVLESRAKEFFDLDHPSRFMLETCQVTDKLTLPAVTHVDGSARVQTVNAKISPRYSALLTRLEELTGCPIVLNTSFNLRGEPIVLDPFDAFWCFLRSDIDCLVLEDCIIDRNLIPEDWLKIRVEAEREYLRGRTKRELQSVYSFF